MLVLGIETATPQVGVALGGPDGQIASFHVTRDRHHAEVLVPAVQFVTEQAGIDVHDVRVVAVDIGPGLFTGLRVGLSTAKSFAHALGVPMVGVSSLDLVAYDARLSDRMIVATVDARRGEVFHAAYVRVPGGVQRISEPAVSTPDDLAAEIQAVGRDVLVVGDGGQRYADRFTDHRGVEVGHDVCGHPNARALVELARAKAVREEFVPASMISPLYLRDPDARVNFSVRDRAIESR
jgi:tRNA threonylcarbamoyladenosine biosynthesis protein TsaB